MIKQPRKSFLDLLKYFNRQNIEISSEKLSSVCHADTVATPWYIQAMLIFAAWVSTLLMFSFLALFINFSNKFYIIIAGAILSASAAVLYRAKPEQIFLRQIALILSIVGVAFIIESIAELSHSVRTIGFALMMIELLVFIVHNDSIRRFLAVGSITVGLMMLIHSTTSVLPFQLVLALLASLTLMTWEYEPLLLKFKGSWQGPVRYGLLISFLILSFFIVLNQNNTPIPEFRQITIYWWPVTIVITLLFMFLINRAINRLVIGHRYVALLAYVLVLLIAGWMYHTPGILSALFVITLGFSYGSRMVSSLGVAFLIYFLSFYYYQLSLTLLQKSISLMGAGSVLILAAVVMHRLLKSKGKTCADK